ncbi:DUF6221 family protein [Glycomyces artemisiae]|uniref:Uncharacterized protein n=1 Tax=Glycomyces artemisiae TaxID=1076443 RepID=A0A2T0UET4_9ACTN|nr:DUF6221 family protein [Glycomyces artemisiae]PRY56455.1 hypothetical protein B0I28_109104 [Glycomyces artemisiae]
MTNPIGFLEARLTEDEAIATEASPGPWHLNAEHDEVIAVDDIEVCTAFALSSNQQRNTARHIARHDPSRVLREIQAKRALLAIYKHAIETWDIVGDGFRVVERAVVALAAVYSDHPDYDPTWATAETI